MTGTPCLCAASTMEAAISPLCGAMISTSIPCVNMFSACLICSLSFPLATCTFSSAPISLQCFSTRSLSRCQRSSFKVSIEKPILTGSLGPFFFRAPLLVCWVPETQAPMIKPSMTTPRSNVSRCIDHVSLLTRLTKTAQKCAAILYPRFRYAATT